MNVLTVKTQTHNYDCCVVKLSDSMETPNAAQNSKTAKRQIEQNTHRENKREGDGEREKNTKVFQWIAVLLTTRAAATYIYEYTCV